ncbi:fungal cellulose binding domain containing protein [Rhodotorula toruloides NP11]|uniref:Fungal cellulose binding domain containing protein n=1 Tax=Rhodotorula toruloides (strain NP11) TaxID=1130832 RepID=M7X222_RHOT1|nr:fungal cellulose binding domain containing protein [Rhodotorula toruloides NP11]EMS24155.1 fungal cellulose binding domain containing protein [Rhodotorula toruloides NP11]
MHLSILLSLVTTALPLALVDAAPAPAADVASTDSYRDDGHCGGGGGYGGKVDDWGRCGGKGYTGPTECKDGFYCKLWSEWYSQCIEKPHPYPPPPKTTISTTTWAPYPTYVPGGGKCNSWQKCESGFTCVKGHCVKDHKTSSTTSYKTSSTSKTPYPTHKPQCWSDKQCSYGEVCFEGYCKKEHKPTTSCSTSTTSKGGYPHSTSTTSYGAYPTGYPSTAPAWGQCGGKGWHGPTTCGAGYVCKYQNVGWSMCEPKH